MMREEYLWGFANPVPLRAVFADGSSTPVVGFAAVRSPIGSGDAFGSLVTLMVGVAIFNQGLVFCESCPDFIGYAEPAVVDPKTGKIKENEPEALYREWKRQGQDSRDKETDMEIAEPGMTGQKMGIEPDESMVDGTDDKGNGTPE